MGFLKPKSPAPTPVPTAEPIGAQASVTEEEVDPAKKKKELLKTGKSSLTVQLKKDNAGLNVGTDSSAGSGLSVGGS